MTGSDLTQHVEVIAVVIRGGPAYRRPGDPFTWSCTASRSDERSAHVVALRGAPTLAELRSVRRELLAMGFERVHFQRVDGRRGDVQLHAEVST